MLPDCFALGIPEGLHSKGREDKQDFESNEFVYRRFRDRINVDNSPNWRGSTSIPANIFSLNNDSYVRQKYSLAETDVLYNTNSDEKSFKDWGIISLYINDFALIEQKKLETDDKKDHVLRLEMKHDPLPCMYPHSELKIYDNGTLVTEQPPRQVRSFIRREIVKVCNIIKDAEQ